MSNIKHLHYLLITLVSLMNYYANAQCSAQAGPNVSVCIGSTVQLGGTPAATGPGTFTYSWSPTTGLNDPTLANPVLTGSVNQVYTLTVTSSTGCSNSDNVSVTALPVPFAGFIFSPTNGCANIPVQFTSTSTGTGLSYSWNFGDPSSGSANTSNQQNPSHTFTAVGTGSQNFSVTLIVTNSQGCSASISQNVTVLRVPNPILLDPLADMKNCNGSNFDMTVYDGTTTSSNSNYTIQWGDGSPDFNSSTFPGTGVNHLYSTADIFTLTYIITGTNGCIDTTNYNVANITNPAIGAANPGATTGCGPLTLCFPLNNYSSNHSTTYYVVDYGDMTPLDTLPHPPPATICHTYTQSSCGQGGNQYVFKIKAINLCDSSEATISPIRVYTGPTANFNPAVASACVGTPVTFLNTSIAGFNSSCSASTLFQWNFGDGGTLTTATLTNPSHAYAAPGTYTISLTTSNSCGSNTITRTVCIEIPPVPNFTLNPATGCVPFITTITDNSTLLNTCSVTRLWTVLFNGSPCAPGVGSFSFVGGTSASSVNPQIQFQNAGNYTVRLTLTNSCGSFTFDQAVVAKTIPIVGINPISSFCASGTIAPVGTVQDCLDPISSYAWTFTGGTPNTSSTFSPGSISYSGAGTYPITFSATNSCGTGTANTSVIVNPLPPALNPNVNSPICIGDTANFTATGVAGVNYQWTGPNSFTSSSQIFNLNQVTAAQAGTYTLIGTLNGCSGPGETVNLVINPIPVVTVSPATPAICANQSVVLTASGASNYTWSPATGLNTTIGTTVTATLSTTQTYTVIGNNGTCNGSASVTITVNPSPVVNAGTDTTVCDQPVPFPLGASPAGGTWSGTNVSSGGLFTPNGAGSFTLTYSFTDVNGCSNQDTRVVTVIAPIQANAGADTTVCLNSGLVQFTGAPIGGTWTGTSVNTSGQFTPATVGSFNLVYTFGSGACLTRDTLVATVNPLPLVDAGTPFSVCVDAVDQTVVGSPVGGTWTGTGITNSTGTFTPSSAIIGSNNLIYTYIDPLTSCQNTANLIVTVNPLPLVNAGSDTSLCNQAFGVQLVGTPASGTWSGPNVTSTGVFTPSGTGTFTLTYSFTNANGCTASDTRLVTVTNPIQPDAGNDVTVCINVPSVQLNGTPAGGTWTGTGISTSGIFTPSIAGTFTVVYSIGQGNCLLRDTALVTVNPLPVVNAGSDIVNCIDFGNVSLTGTPLAGTWTGTGITNSTGTFNTLTAGAGSFVLTYTYTDPATGCSSNDGLNSIVSPLPIVNAGADTTLCNQPFPVQLTSSPAGGTWSGPNVTASGLYTPSSIGTETVSYTFTNANGCTNTDSRNITVVNPIQSNAGPDLAVCVDGANVQLNGTPASGTWTGTDVSSTGIFNPTTAGNFSLVLSNGAGNCLTRDTMVFTVNPLPIVSIGPNRDFCPSDSPVNLSSNVAGGTWSGTGITNTTLGTFTPSVSVVGTNQIIYTYTDPITGCLNRDTLLAIVHPFPVANFTYNPIACLGVTETFTNTSTLGNTYAWNFGDGGTSGATNPSHTYASAGFFTIQLNVTSAFGCLDFIAQPIEIRIPPLADFSISPDSACAPVLVSFTDLSSGPSLTYAWNFGNGATSSAPNPTSQTYVQGYFADTTYTITLTLTNFCGTSIHTEQVTAMPRPTAVLGTATDIGCSPLILDMVNNSLGLPDTYYWDFGDGSPTSSSSASTLQHTYTTGINDTTFTITLAVTNECGTDTTTHTITVLPNQVNAFFNTNIVSGCVPLTVNFTQFSQGSNTSSWDFGDGNQSTIYSPTHTFTTAGTYTVSLFANDGCGYDTATATITVFPSPIVAFNSTPDSVCILDDFQFINQSVGLASSTWYFGDGDSSLLTNPTHAYLASGTYTVTLVGVGQTNGCTASVSHTIVVSTNPVANFTATPQSGCVPLTVQFTNLSTNTNFQAWDFGDGNGSTQFSPNHTYTSPGNFTITLYVENANGCSDSIQQIVTVYPLPTAAFTFVSSDPCIQPTTINFTNNSTGALSYAWDFGDGTTSPLTSPTHSYTSAGDYVVSLTAETIYGCQAIYTDTVHSYNLASASFTLPEDSVCVGEPIVFVSTSSNTLNLTWDFGDGTVLSGNQVSYSFPGSGTFPITVIAYGAGGCNDTATINTPIVVMPKPIAGFDFENLQNPDPLSGTVVFTNTSQLADSYVWDFGNGDTSTLVNPTERYNNFGDFEVTLVAITNFGCTDTIIQTVSVDFFYGLYIPNAMSPGHSSFEVANFIPKGVGLKTFELLIYDDWGNLIWSTSALDADGRPTEYWDGTYKGEPVQQDSYVWKATATFANEKVWEGKEYENGKIKRSGTVTVIR